MDSERSNGSTEVGLLFAGAVLIVLFCALLWVERAEDPDLLSAEQCTQLVEVQAGFRHTSIGGDCVVLSRDYLVPGEDSVDFAMDLLALAVSCRSWGLADSVKIYGSDESDQGRNMILMIVPTDPGGWVGESSWVPELINSVESVGSVDDCGPP